MKKKAFTLVELMLAAGLMTIIFTVVLSIVSNVLNTWNRTSGSVKAQAQANVMLKMIQEDLECMVIRQDGGAWLQVAYPENVGMLAGKTSTSTSPLMPPEIYFYSTPIDRPRYSNEQMLADAYSRVPISGSLCAMKYKLALKSPFLASTGDSLDDANQFNAFYGFYRAVMDSQSTFESALGEDAQGLATDDVSNKLYNFWTMKSAQVLGEDGTRTTQLLKSWALAAENLLATNVVDFRISFTVKYPDPSNSEFYDKYLYATIPPLVPFTLSDKLYIDSELYTRSEETGSIVYNVSPSDVENASLAYAEISLTILTSTGEKEMIALMGTNMNNGNNKLTEEDFRRIVSANSETVVKRISFIGDTL